MPDFHDDHYQFVGPDLIDNTEISHTYSIEWLRGMELLCANWEWIFREAIYAPPHPLLDGSVESGKITLSARSELNGVGHGREPLKAKLRLYFLPGNEAAGLFHNLPRLF